MATKLRALYQRRKGRDLFDLWRVLDRNLININTMISIFTKYCIHNNEPISRIDFLENLDKKRNHPDFNIDMLHLLKPNIVWDFNAAMDMVSSKIINKLP